VVIVLAATVVTVLARQPRSRAAVLLGAPAVLLLDLTGDGWGMPAHAMSLMLGPAAALAVVLALSAIPPSARPSAAIVALIATALIGTAGIVLGDRRGDQPPASAVNTASIEAAKRSEE
jgi:hypothetical protein